MGGPYSLLSEVDGKKTPNCFFQVGDKWVEVDLGK